MIATVTFVRKDVADRTWRAFAIHPRGIRPPALELYAAAYAGDGAELTGTQVLDEFGTMSGPILVVPEQILGSAYDAALTFAFDRDADLAIGSGWPPLVVGLDEDLGGAARGMDAADLAPLFRESERVSVAEGPVKLGYATKKVGGTTIEAHAVVRRSSTLESICLVVLVTDASIGPRELRRLAGSALAWIGTRFARRLSVAVSVAEPTRYDPAQAARRVLDRGSLTAELETAALETTHDASALAHALEFGR
jgi:hypothetical protein